MTMEHSFELFEHAYEYFNLIVHGVIIKGNSELDSFGSSTVPGHFRINIFVFPECQSIPIY